MVTLLRRGLTDAEARAAAAWAYPRPHDVYDSDPRDHRLFLRRGRDDGEGYYPAVDEDDGLVAFVVFGAEARVQGQEPIPGVVDVGVGIRPAAAGHGLGTALLPQAVALARDLFAPTALRAAVAVFNERSLALCARAGFRPLRDFRGPADRAFRELVLELTPDG